MRRPNLKMAVAASILKTRETAIHVLQKIAEHARCALDGNSKFWKRDLQAINQTAREAIDLLEGKE